MCWQALLEPSGLSNILSPPSQELLPALSGLWEDGRGPPPPSFSPCIQRDTEQLDFDHSEWLSPEAHLEQAVGWPWTSMWLNITITWVLLFFIFIFGHVAQLAGS